MGPLFEGRAQAYVRIQDCNGYRPFVARSRPCPAQNLGGTSIGAIHDDRFKAATRQMPQRSVLVRAVFDVNIKIA
jgi:hypothetical protein